MGLAAAGFAQLPGATVVIVGDLIDDRLVKARAFGCETVDVSQGDPKDQIEQILGVPEVNCGVDAVGFEARHGSGSAEEAPATVLNLLMDIARAGGALGIPGLYVTGDPEQPTPPRSRARSPCASSWASQGCTCSSPGSAR